MLRERESSHTSGGGAEGNGERIPSRFCTVSVEPDVGLDLTTARSGPGAKSRGRYLTKGATRVPRLSRSKAENPVLEILTISYIGGI